MYIAGIVLVIISLAAQAYTTLIKKDRGLSPIFLALFALGSIVFVVFDFTTGSTTGNTCGIFDIITTILVIILLIVLLARRKTT